MLTRKYMLLRSTHRFHLYEWMDAPDDSKAFEKQLYLAKAELGEDPPSELVLKIDIE
jgi:hypothetical protein